jgi:hypothetical protein
MRDLRTGLVVILLTAGCAASSSEESDEARQAQAMASSIYECSSLAARLDLRIRANGSQLDVAMLERSDPPSALDLVRKSTNTAIPLSSTYADGSSVYEGDDMRIRLDAKGGARIEAIGARSGAAGYSCSPQPDKPVRQGTSTCTLKLPEGVAMSRVPATLSVALSPSGVTVIEEKSSSIGSATDDPMAFFVEYRGFAELAKSVAPKESTPESPSDRWADSVSVRLSRSLVETGAGTAGIVVPMSDGFLAPYECK